MKMLVKKCPETINTKGEFLLNSNNDGSPWTEYDFVKLDGIFQHVENGNKFSEYLFYRIDRKRNQYYLRISQYAWIGKNKADKELKIRRLKKYRELFESAKCNQKSGIEFSNPSDSGTHEMEVGI